MNILMCLDSKTLDHLVSERIDPLEYGCYIQVSSSWPHGQNPSRQPFPRVLYVVAVLAARFFFFKKNKKRKMKRKEKKKKKVGKRKEN